MDPHPASESRLDPRRLLQLALEGMEEQESQAPPVPDSARVSAAFPEYEILGLIGRGGMGAVYKARLKSDGRLVALKILADEHARDPSIHERLEREARAQAAVEHPNILAVHRFGQQAGFSYLVTDYVDGVDLRQMMRMGRLSARETLSVVAQLCEGLQFAHDHGLVHRDVKPENILIDSHGRVRIADFGLVKIVKDGDSPFPLTMTHQAVGTPHYMAPEQLRSSGATNVDHRADLYALGVVLYELLTGQLPLGHFVMPSQVVGTDPDLDRVVIRALAQAVEQRYQRASELKTDLERVSRTATPPSHEPGHQAQPRLPWLSLTAMLASMAALALFFYWMRLDENFVGDSAKEQWWIPLGALLALIGACSSLRGFRYLRHPCRRARARDLVAVFAAWLPVLLAFDAAVVRIVYALQIEYGIESAEFAANRAAAIVLLVNLPILGWQSWRGLRTTKSNATAR